MAYGVQITPEDGGPPIDITLRARVPSWLDNQLENANSPTTDGNTGRAPYTAPNYTPGATLFFIPTRVLSSGNIGGSAGGFQTCVVDHVEINGGSAVFVMRRSRPGLNYLSRCPLFKTYQVLGAGTTGYGIGLQDNSDFTAISDTNMVGASVYRGQPTITGDWSLPNFPGRDDCVVFANWSNPGVAVEYDANSKVIHVSDGNNGNGTAQLNIVIFASKVPPTPPAYGLAIYNVNHQCTFSSRSAPMLLRGSVSLDNTHGANAHFNYFDGVVLDRPMVPLGIWGVQGVANSSDNFSAYNSGMVMNGANLTAGRGKLTGNVIGGNAGSIPNLVSSIAVPLLNGRDYFNNI